MKNITRKLLLLGLTATILTCELTACKINPSGKVNVNVNVNGSEVINTQISTSSWKIDELNKVSVDQKNIFDEATGKLDGYFYEPVALLGTQLVSGTNYAFLCKPTISSYSAMNSLVITYIYVDLSGDASFLGDERVVLPGTEGDNTNLAGGWRYAESTEVTSEINDMIANVNPKDANDYYLPIAYVGSQVVSGTNHAVLCKAVSNTAADKTSLVIVYVYENLEGKCEITGTEDIKLSIG